MTGACFQELIDLGLRVSATKAEHDLLENIIPHMNFSAIHAKTEEIMGRILKYRRKKLSSKHH